MQDYVNQALVIIAIAVVGMLTRIFLRTLSLLEVKWNEYIESKKALAKTTESLKQIEMVQKIASEVFSVVEKEFYNMPSSQKYNEAFSRLSKRAAGVGIPITPEQIKGAIEKAVLDYNAKTKTLEYKKTS
ncbi:phage holin, LLH family [Paenibacillus rhizophilus]|uniref:Phage holin n=1 Tax=Paenibacillus rhizophilus TaxID=1850366 RepID=A0A3N9PUH1_9BACL|nr:phage holin, LLH family [Paenibacillus rhizophilus]RQW10052.1 hypothetical protein EH198_16595 [Paenibacillus rhizophilus]